MAVFFDVWFNVNGASGTASVDLNNGATDVDTRTTTTNTIVNSRSGSLSLTNGDTFDLNYVNSNQPAAGVFYYIANLVIQATFGGVAGSKRQSMFLLGVQ